MSPLASVLQTLPTLSTKDLEVVTGRVKALLPMTGRSGVVTRDTDSVKDYLLEGVHIELRKRGIIGQRDRILQRNFPTHYTDTSLAVRNNLESFLPDLRYVEKIALGTLAASVLASWLEERNIPVGPKTMLNNVSNIPLSLEQSFPGYLRSGLLHLCWKKSGDK